MLNFVLLTITIATFTEHRPLAFLHLCIIPFTCVWLTLIVIVIILFVLLQKSGQQVIDLILFPYVDCLRLGCNNNNPVIFISIHFVHVTPVAAGQLQAVK